MSHVLDVLVVEDDPTQRLYIEAVMRGGGYRCRTADGIQTALELLRALQFRLVVADATLGNDSACALIKQIRAHTPMRNLPIIGISVSSDQADALLAAGTDAFLMKPFRGSQLLAAIPPLLMRGRPVRGVRLDKKQ